MLKDLAEVILKGDRNGNNMAVQISLPSGRKIMGLPTENFYGGGWDLGPSWNYVVSGDSHFLVDTGRFGMGRKLLDMMTSVGVSGKELDFVVISHGHEDHDGGLPEIVESTGVHVKAHSIYERLIHFYPSLAPEGFKKDFPASCWRCFMPESFSTKNCLVYHQSRSRLMIQKVGNGHSRLAQDIFSYHVPGHSPDSLAILVGEEAIIVGDTVLPEITPIPSRENLFDHMGEILKPQYTSAQAILGLISYIKSFKKLRQIGEKFPGLLVLPAHRLFFDGHWNEINLVERIDELIEHHIERCSAVLTILKQGPRTAREIAVEHFEEPLLRGVGILMAENEIISHCELLYTTGDLALTEDMKYITSGTTNFESFIQSLEPDQASG